MSKKGSMELGINAIVVIIIALAILGLGIGFVTKLLGGSQDKLGSIIERTELPVHADSQNQIVFESSTIKVKQGSNSKLTIAVYNNLNGDAEGVTLMAETCVDDSNEVVDGIIVTSPAQSIPRGMEGGFSAIIKTEDGLKKATYICTIRADLESGSETAVLSKQIFIEVI